MRVQHFDVLGRFIHIVILSSFIGLSENFWFSHVIRWIFTTNSNYVIPADAVFVRVWLAIRLHTYRSPNVECATDHFFRVFIWKTALAVTERTVFQRLKQLNVSLNQHVN